MYLKQERDKHELDWSNRWRTRYPNYAVVLWESPLVRRFHTWLGPEYGWAGLKPLPNKAMNNLFIHIHTIYTANFSKSVAWMHLFHENVSFRNICCWPGRVHYVHGHISCNGHASTFCHTNRSGRCHCCRRDDGSVEEEVGVDELELEPLPFNDFKGCMHVLVWPLCLRKLLFWIEFGNVLGPSPTNHGRYSSFVCRY